MHLRDSDACLTHSAHHRDFSRACGLVPRPKDTQGKRVDLELDAEERGILPSENRGDGLGSGDSQCGEDCVWVDVG